MRQSAIHLAVRVAVVTLCCGLSASAGQPQTAAARPSIASVMNQQLGVVEQQFVSAAEAMPADRYSFAPTAGNFAGVRTFAQQVKHVATVNYVFYSALLGQAPPAEVTENKQMNGPASTRTKEQIVEYLKRSFAFAHDAVSTITPANATSPLGDSSTTGAGIPPFLNTRLALASFGCVHVFDHYGQIVEYLRMNGVVPPASQGQPPANPRE